MKLGIFLLAFTLVSAVVAVAGIVLTAGELITRVLGGR